MVTRLMIHFASDLMLLSSMGDGTDQARISVFCMFSQTVLLLLPAFYLVFCSTCCDSSGL